MKEFLKALWGPLIAVFALLAARWLIPGKMNFLTEVSIFSIYVIGCNLLYGYLGMVSFGQPFYLTVGAYSTGIYLAYFGTSPMISLGIGIGAGLLAGLILGPFFVRLRGDYFALVNLAICAIGVFIVEKLLLPITRGDDGLWYRARMADTPFLDIRQSGNLFLFVVFSLFVVLVLFRYMDRSTLGASFRAVKGNERKMKFLGFSTFKLKLTGFTLASMLASFSGSLFAINFGFVNPNLGTPGRAADVLVATLMGGAGTVYGPLFGSFAFLGFRDIVSSYTISWELFVGILTILVLFKFNKGIWGNIEAIIAEKFYKKL